MEFANRDAFWMAIAAVLSKDERKPESEQDMQAYAQNNWERCITETKLAPIICTVIHGAFDDICDLSVCQLSLLTAKLLKKR